MKRLIPKLQKATTSSKWIRMCETSSLPSMPPNMRHYDRASKSKGRGNTNKKWVPLPLFAPFSVHSQQTQCIQLWRKTISSVHVSHPSHTNSFRYTIVSLGESLLPPLERSTRIMYVTNRYYNYENQDTWYCNTSTNPRMSTCLRMSTWEQRKFLTLVVKILTYQHESFLSGW